MTARVEQWSLPLHAATDIPAYTPVGIGGATGALWAVTPVGTSVSVEPIGITHSYADQGHAVRVVHVGNIAKAVAGATVAAGNDVGYSGVGTTSGATLGTILPQAQLGPVSRASGVAGWRLGTSLESANPGQVFAFLVNPRELGGLS